MSVFIKVPTCEIGWYLAHRNNYKTAYLVIERPHLLNIELWSRLVVMFTATPFKLRLVAPSQSPTPCASLEDPSLFATVMFRDQG